MGGGTYSYERAEKSSSAFMSMSLDEVMPQRQKKEVHREMSPYNIKLRESRDSEEHPESFAIILGLDVTGSMYSMPYYIITEVLPDVIKKLIDSGIPNPQVLFMGIGDHTCDSAPFQVGQFESSDQLMNHWLKNLYPEGGGGGNDGESYFIPWYFAGNRTSIDCWEKRKKKGILITIGDEPCLDDMTSGSLKHIFGDGQYSNITAQESLEKAQSMYHVFHINIKSGARGRDKITTDWWQQHLGDNFRQVEDEKKLKEYLHGLIMEAYNTKYATDEETKEDTPML